MLRHTNPPMTARSSPSIRDPESTSTALDHAKPDAELYLREHAPAPVRERQRAVRERLADLARSDELGDVSVAHWSKTTPAAAEARASAAGRPALAVDRFEAWAARSGCDLEPGFVRRTSESMLGGRTDEVIQLPFICLALTVDGELAAVFPHRDDGVVRTVTDCLDGLERGGWRFAWTDEGGGKVDPSRQLQRPARKPSR